jgi:hypothetical protein
MFSVVKQGREILKVHFMSHYLSESENTGAKLKHLRSRMSVEIIFDEMTIQSDLQFHSKNGIKYLIEFTDILDESQFSREASDTGEFT